MNIATIWQLKSCPKVGDILAHRIVASRQVEKFTSWSEVRRLSSVGKGITNHLQKKFFLPEDDEDEPERRLQVMVRDDSPHPDREWIQTWKKRSRRAGQNKRDQRAKENAEERSRVQTERQAAQDQVRSTGSDLPHSSDVKKRTSTSARESSHLVSTGYAHSCRAKAPAPETLESSLEQRFKQSAAAAETSTDHLSARESSRDNDASSHPLG